MAKTFIAALVLCGTTALVYAFVPGWPKTSASGVGLLVVSCVASRLRVKLPGLTGTMSINLPFILLAVATLSISESMVVGCVSTLTQCLPAAQKKFNAIQAMFNVCNMALAVTATRLIFTWGALDAYVTSHPLRLVTAAAGFFLVNTIPVAVIISLTEKCSVVHTWAGMFQLSFPYYVISAATAGIVFTLAEHMGWLEPMAILLIMLGVLNSYRCYFPQVLYDEVNSSSGASAQAESGV